MTLSRRQFIAATSAAAATSLAYWRTCSYDSAQIDAYADLAHLSPRRGAILAAVIATMLPPSADHAAATIAGHVRAIDAYLTGLPAADTAQLSQCLDAIEHATLPFGGHAARFTSLAPAARADVLAAWQTSSYSLARLGFRSLKALVFLAYYRDAAAWRAIRYSGPAMPDGGGAPAVRATYAALLAPPGAHPGDLAGGR